MAMLNNQRVYTYYIYNKIQTGKPCRNGPSIAGCAKHVPNQLARNSGHLTATWAVAPQGGPKGPMGWSTRPGYDIASLPWKITIFNR